MTYEELRKEAAEKYAEQYLLDAQKEIATKAHIVGAEWEAEREKWISCADALPETDISGVTEVLAYVSDIGIMYLSFVKHEHNPGNFYMDYKNHFDTYTETVTHWQYITPPKTSKQ